MKILQVIPYFTPQMGGLVPAVSNLSNLLAQRGHEVVILTTDYKKDNLQKADELVSVVVHKNLFAGFNFFFSPGMKSWLRKNLGDFDVVHLHGFRTYQSLLVSRWSSRSNVPYVLTPHGTVRVSDRLLLVKRVFDLFFGNWILKEARRLFAVCPPEARELQEKKINSEKVILLYTGLNLGEFENLPQKGVFKEKFGIPQETKIILSLGRIHRIKGLDVLIKSHAQLLGTGEDTRLVIVGPDEGFLEELKNLVKVLDNADKVIFTGPLYGKDKLAAYLDADVFVLNSSIEAFGTVSFEAIFSGAPLIISEKCGMSEVIREHKAGFVTPYGDVQGLTQLISRVLDGGEEIEQSVMAGKKLIRGNFSWEVIADKLEKEYEGLITK
jgi:glycosyltransferase involved in cell wall biosynthesis